MVSLTSILTMAVIFVFYGQTVQAENDLQKSFQLLKNAIEIQQNNKSNGGSDLLKDVLQDTETNSNQQISSVYWNYKADFLSDVSKGKMLGYVNVYADKEKIIVINSLRSILANDYQVVVPEGRGERKCEVAFEINVDELLKLYTRDNIKRLGNNPPDFIETSSDNIINSANANFSGLNQNCSKDVLGLKIPTPFIDPLKLLLKEYSEMTEAHVNKLRSDKVAAYQITLKQEVELAKDLARQDEQAKRIEQINEKLEQNKQARMDACLVSPAFKLYKTSSEVEEGLKLKVKVKQEIEKEQEIGKISGYVNATRLNELGRVTVNIDSLVKSNYASYKKHGGKASSPNKVVAIANPCH